MVKRLTMSEVKFELSSKEIQKRTDDRDYDNGEGLFTRGRPQSRDNKTKKHKNSGKPRSNSNSRGTTRKKCYYCKKEGPFRDECLASKAKLRTEGNNGKVRGDVYTGYEFADVLVVSNVDSRQEWMLDSGCTFHMCPLFCNFEEKIGGRVLLGDNKPCTI
uniref:Gag-pol polyprotein n=1 Tax=Cannabis sativa TaxID=3483 RepID=A0A803PER1_CANSA